MNIEQLPLGGEARAILMRSYVAVRRRERIARVFSCIGFAFVGWWVGPLVTRFSESWMYALPGMFVGACIGFDAARWRMRFRRERLNYEAMIAHDLGIDTAHMQQGERR